MPARTTPTNLPPPPTLWQTLGPSFILLGLALGSGELILWPYLAATYGLGIMWGGLVGISFQYLLNTEVMRYSLAWGESVFVGWRKLSRLLPLWFIISTFIPWALPGFAAGIAQTLQFILPGLPLTPVAIATLLLTGLILSMGKTLYGTMETVQRTLLMVSIPFFVIVAAILVPTDAWGTLTLGLVGKGDGWWFLPNGISLAAFLGAFAYSGGAGNLNLSQSYYIKEKGHGMGRYAAKISSLFSGTAPAQRLTGHRFADTPLNRRRWQEWWRLIATEHGIIFWGLGLLSILVLATLSYALLLGTHPGEGIAFLATQSQVLDQHLFVGLGAIMLAIVATQLMTTQIGVLESASRIISENWLLLWHQPKDKVDASKAFYVVLWSFIAIGIVTLLSGFKEPRALLTTAAVLNAGAMMVGFPLILWLNHVALPKHFRAKTPRVLGMIGAMLFFLIFLYFLIFQ